MKKLFKNILQKINRIVIILLFLVSAVIVTLLLPGEGRFNYEYYRGRPWVHESLSAKFRFPIYKTDEEVNAERDSIINDLNYYFDFNDNVVIEQIRLFRDNFENEWEYYSVKEYKISSSELYFNNNRYVTLRNLHEKYSSVISELLREVYTVGVINYADIDNQNLKVDATIRITKGNNVEEKKLDQLFTSKKAYQYVIDGLQRAMDSESNRQIRRYNNFFDQFLFENYITHNITYNASTTEKEKQERLEEISLSKGMIQEGERIISEGEIVTPEKFQVLESLRHEYSLAKGNVSNVFVKLGKFLFIIICFSVVYAFLAVFRKEILAHFIRTVFILFLQLVFLSVTSVIAKYNLSLLYIIPYAILPIILRIFYDERLAFFIHVMTIVMAAVFAPVGYEFTVLNIIAGMVAILSLTNLYRRSRFFLSAIIVTLAYSITYFGLSVALQGSFSNIEWQKFVYYFPLNGLLILMSFLLIYLFEKLFGFLSDTTLMELADTNQNLLRQLAEKAPGTFQHSMQVANLAEEAALKINGNPLLVRTGALYHDIGKIAAPEYFTENQSDNFNPHEKLEHKESAKKIIDHIIGGVELAKKNKLPEPIIDFIRTHQGTDKVKYFYRMYKKEHPDEIVKPDDFQYPGPKPQTKEHVVLMMADTIEAASRSLKEYTEEAIDELVETLINMQMGEGQFEEASITFKEIKEVKEVFKNKLKNIYHARIAYPKA